MAKRMKPGASPEGTMGARHNIANLEVVIKECAAAMLMIKRERGGLNERAGDIRTRLKEAGVQTAAFDFALRVQDMEQEARSSYLESLRVNFDALGIGSQGTMGFPEASKPNGEDQAPEPDPAPEAPKAKRAKKAGKGAPAAS